MSEQRKMYRKKPITVLASQWHKQGDHDAVTRLLKPDPLDCEKCGNPYAEHGAIRTLEDTDSMGHLVCPGDWVITGVKGEYYACKPDIFAATYEPAEENMSEQSASKTPRTDEFWETDTPNTLEECVRLLRFGAVLNPLLDSVEVNQERTEKRMLNCAKFVHEKLNGAVADLSAANERNVRLIGLLRSVLYEVKRTLTPVLRESIDRELLEQVNAAPQGAVTDSKLLTIPKALLYEAWFWLDGAVTCKNFVWDADQKELAEGCCKEILKVVNGAGKPEATPAGAAQKQACWHAFESAGPAGQYFCVKCRRIFEY